MEKIGERQVVSIVVGGRVNTLGTLEIWHSFGDFLGLDIELAEVVVGVKTLRLELGGLLKLLSGAIELSQTDEIGGEIGPCGCGAGVQPNGFLKVSVGGGVLGLRGVNQAQKLVNLKAFRDLLEQTLELCGGFGVVPRVILSNGRLELMVEALVLVGTCRATNAYAKRNRRTGLVERLPMNTAVLGYHCIRRRGKIEQKRVPRRAPSTSTLRGGGVAKWLEVQLQSELDLPRIVGSIARGTNFAEG